jgi:2-phosphoglycerate kinase
MSYRLTHVYWMGGSPCLGKSSVTMLLAKRYRLLAYHCDDAFATHRQRISRDRHPMLYKWTQTSWNVLWIQPAKALVLEAIACYQEHF